MSGFSYSHYTPISLSQIRPTGWIMMFLTRQCAGITGHPQASGYPLDHTFWGNPDQTLDILDPGMAWWPYEQTAYWVDGALKAGFLAGDETVYQMARKVIDQTIEHAAPDGFIGPDMFRAQNRWPYTIFFRAILAQFSITGDRRYLDALIHHYHSTP